MEQTNNNITNSSSNVIVADNGLEIYLDRVAELADEYIQSLPNPDIIYGNNKLPFTGMIKHIYINYFKHIKWPFEDVEFLYKIWEIYTTLCYKYQKKPNIINFCIMTGWDHNNILSWCNSTSRIYVYYDMDGNIINNITAWQQQHPGEEYTRKLSLAHTEFARKIAKECEGSLVDAVSEEGKNIGAIFLLKAQYGYRETAPEPAPAPTVAPLGLDQLPQLGLPAPNLSPITDINTTSSVCEVDRHNI